MALQQGPEGSEDVNDFLVRIRELGEKRDKEDEERVRTIEDEILQGRKERQAKRAERARSISPTKDSPLTLDSPVQRESPSGSSASHSIVPPVEFLPPTKSLDLDRTARDMTTSNIEIHTNGRAAVSSRNSTDSDALSLSRSRTMSWKQRPQSRDIESLASTLKFPGDQPASKLKNADDSPAKESELGMSRAQIAQSLGAKDPSWFSQTSNRGIGSQAYRKSQNTSISDMPLHGGGIKLHGLKKDFADGPESSADGSERSRSPSRASSVYGAGSIGNRFSSVSSVSTTGGLGSPMPLSSAHRQEGRGQSTNGDLMQSERVTMSPSQSRLSSERPSSPTKGMGGFVQSAMMKRSDSVSKRWSAQPGTNSFRNSMVSPRSERPPSRSSFQASRPALAPGESFTRPGSSHSEATVIRHSADETASNFEGENASTETTPTRRLQNVSISPSRPSSVIAPEDLPVSPSKTMDPKRWSPTKSSWLASALNKPDLPRPKTISMTKETERRTGLTNTMSPLHNVERKDKTEKPSVARPDSSDLGNHANTPVTDKSKENLSPSKAAPDPKETDSKTNSRVNNDSKNLQLPSPVVPPKSRELDLKGRISSTSDKSPVQVPDISPTSPGERTVPGLPIQKAPPPKPPVNDLRANLRHRAQMNEKQNSEVAEFKSVFGKLRRAETKNYVAPDELKDNILRGKAALNVTGGPKRTARVDEFKESILKQKAAMQAGGGSIRRPSTASESRTFQPPQAAIPEALAKFSTLNRSDSVRSNFSSAGGLPATPRPLKSKQTSNEGLKSSSESGRTSPSKPSNDVQEIPHQEKLPSQLPEKPKPNPRPDLSISQAPLKVKISPKSSVELQPEKPLQSPAAATRPGIETSKGKLADRLNPALAGILARGPPPAEKSQTLNGAIAAPSTQSPPDSKQTQLTHMTKSRAKGPKRRLPQKSQAETLQPVSSSNAEPTLQTEETKSPSALIRKERQATAAAETTGTEVEKPKNADGLESDKKSPRNTTDNNLELLPSTTYKPKTDFKPLPKLVDLDAKNEAKGTSNVASNTNISLVKARQTSISPKETAPSPSADLHPNEVDNPPKPPSKAPKNHSHITVPTKSVSPKASSPSVGKRIVSPPVPPKPIKVINHKNLVSTYPQTPKAAQLFIDFFDIPPSATNKVDVDPSFILSSNSAHPKIKTLKKQIWEFSSDGRRNDLPANQEYILFEESMYLCIHTYEIGNGSKTTQTHLWCGDGVGEATIEDAQLFARKLARENNCKLEILRQGKETASFIQALGGILLTRRGASNRADSSALYMLCGRRHMGQITFDEVDLSPHSLSSGFPFIVSAKFGCLYLWKGRGSTADELGCARLIGMDIGLTGEIEEINEGEEPDSFFECFPDSGGARTYPSASHWQFKPNNEKYQCRLFRIDHNLARPNDTVQEISPFCQRDLDPEHIYILDAFYEVYVIVGERAHSRSAEFASALVFAQEYGFLAVSEQDRPFLPNGSVVMNGLTDECKRIFRKWDARFGGFGDGKYAQVLPLNAAIEAIR